MTCCNVLTFQRVIFGDIAQRMKAGRLEAFYLGEAAAMITNAIQICATTEANAWVSSTRMCAGTIEIVK